MAKKNIDIKLKAKDIIKGHVGSMGEKATSARIYCPKTWVGSDVIVLKVGE